MIGRFILLGALLALAACGNDRSEFINPDLVRGVFNRDAEPQAVDPQAAAALSVRALRALNEPVMLAILESPASTAILVPYGRNAGVETWTTEEFQTLSFRAGVLTATRGLGTDLMSASVSDTARALRTGGGAVTHVWRTIDAANQPVEIARACRVDGGQAETITLAAGEQIRARRVTEACEGGVTNLYWLNAAGAVVQSRQWAGPGTGYLTHQVLRR